MYNYLLFKQIVCLIFLFETLWVWPRFNLYFGPLVFTRSVFTNPFRIHIFNVLLSISLVFLFLNFYSVIASFVFFLCMRYLFVTDVDSRISTFGAVGHVCYLTSVYIFLFEMAFLIDPTHQLADFFHTILAFEIGTMLIAAGLYKCAYGYFKNEGFEYALVNPSWGKFFFLFKKLKPSSWFFKINNFGSVFTEFLAGLFFFFPPTHLAGAYLLQILFFYILLTVRVNVLPFIMMGLSLLYIQPINFHFPTLNGQIPQLALPQTFITLIEIVFIAYLIVYISVTLFRVLQNFIKVALPTFLIKPVQIFIAARPCFEWNVFTSRLTNSFIKIHKISKSSKKIGSTLYDGFSRTYLEIFDDRKLFLRFIHHHESSILLNIFTTPSTFSRKEDLDNYVKEFIHRMVLYSKTLLSEPEMEDTGILFTVMKISKNNDHFSYVSEGTMFIDPKSGTALSLPDVKTSV